MVAGSQAYTISESLHVAFGINPIVFVFLYSFFIYYVTCKGTTRIGKFAEKLVPFMCLAFIVGGILLIIMNLSNLPGVIKAIFHEFISRVYTAGQRVRRVAELRGGESGREQHYECAGL